jgi:hypothetical protein
MSRCNTIHKKELKKKLYLIDTESYFGVDELGEYDLKGF